MKLIKKPLLNQYYKNYVDSETQVNDIDLSLWLDVQPETLHFKLINETENKVYLNLKLSLSEMRLCPSFEDQSYIAINEEIFSPFNFSEVEKNISKNDIYNIFSISINNKRGAEPGLGFVATSSGKSFLKIFVPSKTSTFEDCTFVVYSTNDQLDSDYSKKININVSGPSASIVTEESTSDNIWKNLVAVPTVNNIQKNDSTISVQISVPDVGINEVLLEPVYGLVNKIRVPIVNGSGSFTIITTGLEQGDDVKVKMGYKYLTGIGVVETTV